MYTIRIPSYITLLLSISACAVYPEVSTDEEVLVRLIELEQTIEDQKETIAALEAEVAEMEPLMAYVQLDESDPDLPAVKFVGVNVYVQSGSGATDDGGTPTGLGNLIIGYDETRDSAGDPGVCTPSYVADGSVPIYRIGLESSDFQGDRRTGSHNLVLGVYQNRTSSSAIIAGICNESSATAASTLGGSSNINAGPYGVVVSGEVNHATSTSGSVAILGGLANMASGHAVTIAGGELNEASGGASSIAGGWYNVSSGEHSAVVGGFSNDARGTSSTILGGYDNTAEGAEACVTGGYVNSANGAQSSVLGGTYNITGEDCSYCSIVGGSNNTAESTISVVVGGHMNNGNATRCTVLGGMENSCNSWSDAEIAPESW